MEKGKSGKRHVDLKGYTILVAIDFSSSSAQALRYATSILGRKPSRIVALHVIDHDFVENCIRNELGTEEHIKKTLFLHARVELKNFLEKEGMGKKGIEELICQGMPFIEINKKALEIGADIVVMGNRGNSGDMKTIFFGSTTEKVLRFMKRPVLCVPMEREQ
jgi:nucleotide-binding universal stress UspA family protein